MIERVQAGPRTGSVRVPCSKSEAHRALIAAALSKNRVRIEGADASKDVLATLTCLNALGADIVQEESGFVSVKQIGTVPGEKRLCPGESGSTLRFLLPLAGALGLDAQFVMEGSLPGRPIQALADALQKHGMRLEKTGNELVCRGKLAPGRYTLPGNVSSQFIKGLLFALPLLPGDSEHCVTGETESEGYVRMTLKMLSASGVRAEEDKGLFLIPGRQTYDMPPVWALERDWSQAAFFLCMGALSQNGVTALDMRTDSLQGDKAVLKILSEAGACVQAGPKGVTVQKDRLEGVTIDASGIPDLIPALSALMSLAKGETRVVNASRLRLKESDRLMTTCRMLSDLGADIRTEGDGLVIMGRPFLAGGQTDAQGDHRIAMAAAVAASGSQKDVTVLGAECVQKSYPRFWQDFKQLEADI